MTVGDTPPSSGKEWEGGASAAPSSESFIAPAVPNVHSVVVASEEPGTEQVRLALRVVIHLSRTVSPGPGETALPESTQQGMAARLHVTQGAVSKVLQRLVAANVVHHERHHVRGENRRMRVYLLTDRGSDLARRYRERHPGTDLPP